MRTRLLDLSANNALLNYKHPKASSVRLVDEIPAQVFGRIIGNSAMLFSPLPPLDPQEALALRQERAELGDLANATNAQGGASLDPRERARRERREATARRDRARLAHAVAVGMPSSYDLPSAETGSGSQHRDLKLQTLYYAEELEEQLRKIHRTAKTFIDETGANRLHLMFGFVEWCETAQTEGEQTYRSAPLVLVPVELNRGEVDPDTHTYRYRVTRTGEDWSANVTLLEKCRSQFRLELPDIDVESDESLEAYFSRVENVLRRAQPTWRFRRGITLGLVSFGKVLMWRDLDPANWPATRSIFESDPLVALLGAEGLVDAEGVASSGSGTVDYPLDSLDNAPDAIPAIVIDADSSQHSALVDVERGVNLVLQGPPGTGKSQTITNLIAGALKRGKRVLFIAEKKAALDVVFSRLAKAKLSDFCVALHSHTSAKKGFLEDLDERLGMIRSVPPPAELGAVIERHHTARTALNEHVARVHEPFGPLGLTPFEVFWRTRRLSETLGEDVVSAIQELRLPNVIHTTRQDVERRRDVADDFAGAFGRVKDEGAELAHHPWAGVMHEDLTFADVNDVLDLVHAWRHDLADLEHARTGVEALLESSLPRTTRILRHVVDTVAGLPELGEFAAADLPNRLTTAARLPDVQRAVAVVGLSRQRWSLITGPWGEPGSVSHADAEQHALRITRLASHLPISTPVRAVRALHAAAGVHAGALDAVDATIKHVLGALTKTQTQADVEVTGHTVPALVSLLDALKHLALEHPGAIECIGAATADAPTVTALETAADRAKTLLAEERQLESLHPSSFRPDAVTLRTTATALATAPAFLPWLWSGAYREAVRQYRAASSGRKATRAEMLAEMQQLISHQDAVRSFSARPALASVFGARASGIHSPFADGRAAAAWLKHVRESGHQLGDAGRPLISLIVCASPAEWRDALDRIAHMGAQWAAAQGLASLMETTAATMRRASVEFSELYPLSQTVETLRDLEQQAADVLEVTDSAGLVDDETMDAITTRLDQLSAAWEADAQLAAEAQVLAGLDVVISGPATNVAPIQAGLAYVGTIQAAGLPECVVKWLFGPDARSARRALQGRVESMRDPLTKYEGQAALAVTRTALDVAGWCGSGGETAQAPAGDAREHLHPPVTIEEADLTVISSRIERALTHDRALHPWAVYRRSRANALEQGLGDIVGLVERERIGSAQAADAYEAVFFRTLAETVLRAERALDTFDSGVHTEVQQRYARLDQQLLELTKQVIIHELTHVLPPRGLDGPRVADMTDTALIRHEIGKTRSHIAIRELFRRAGPAIQAIKPCFLMGPQAVAQYLPPGRFEFDLVVMDEASQLRPEDALGAIARGGQVLIVGDPMQLGPTRFFDSQGAGDDDLDEGVEEDSELEEETDADGNPILTAEERQAAAPVLGATVLERSESILLAAAARFPVRMLRWHYRSKHPKLIAFSNREFYNDGLVVFPTPGTNDADDGVFLRRVEGLYGGRRNMPEAQAVVAAVQEHARRFPERSLLVATLNAEQADLIDGLVEAAEKDDPELAAFRAYHAETREPFVIKNLENVQGDERDSIMVSVTFGPNVAGKLNQNFGPINKAGGERRLNVLFTRAKHRLEVFCSFDASMLRVSDSTSPRGLRVLRDYLRYAAGEVWWATGTETGREPDSDFEIAVATALRARGYEVRPQIGVAGYFLDLAVVHPDSPDRFLLAIECDGATYHSAKTARDRDRLRQTQLESLGWHMHRIWSTDWFKHPVGEADRVVRHIEQLRASGDR